MRFIRAVLAVVGTSLAVPGVASADSGAITNVFTASDGSVTATYTATSSCAGEPENPFDCSWWPHAVQGPASLPCYEYVTGDGRLTYVGGGGINDPILNIGRVTDIGSDFFYADWDPVRICLYINYGSDNRVLVADYVHNVTAVAPTLSPPPVQQPQGQPQAAQPDVMSIAEGRSLVTDALKSEFGKRFNRFTLQRRNCRRVGSYRVKCNVSWTKRRYRYRGTVTLWNNPSDGSEYLYDTSIRRKKIKRRARSSIAGASGLGALERAKQLAATAK